jgi:hypothetical protein
MRVEYKREGGFTGIPLSAEFDSESLPPEKAGTLVELVEAADFFHLPARISPPTVGADRFEHFLTVEENGKRHSVTTSGGGPVALQELLEFIGKLAKEKRSQGGL